MIKGFEITESIKRTTSSIYETIQPENFFLSLKYTKEFYSKNQNEISQIINFYSNLGLTFDISIDSSRDFSRYNILEADVCFIDENYIPRIDLPVKISQFKKLTSCKGVNIFGFNVSIFNENLTKRFDCIKPDYVRVSNIYRSQCNGGIYIPKEVMQFNNNCLIGIIGVIIDINELIKSIFPDEKIFNLPVLLAYSIEDVNKIEDVEKLFFTKTRVFNYNISNLNSTIFVVIPFKNEFEMTIKCIDLVRKSNIKNLKVVSLNNNSDTVTQLDEVRLRSDLNVDVTTPYNYSLINNIGLKELYASRNEFDFVLLLNNDVFLEVDTIEKMLGAFNNSNIGAVGCRLIYPDSRLQFGGVGLSHSSRIDGHSWYHIDQPRGATTCVQSNSYFEVHSLTAACMLVRADVLEKISFFNSNAFPIGFSDADLCMRIRDLGYDLFYVPTASAIHHESVSRGFGYPDDLEGLMLARLSLSSNLTFQVVEKLC